MANTSTAQNLDQQIDQPQEYNAKTFKCNSCGNFLRYDPDTNKMKCSYCDSTYELQPTTSAIELQYTSISEKDYEDWIGEKTIKCSSCGAVVSLENYQTATNCPFCNAPNVISIDNIVGIKPNAILPFKISQQKAQTFYQKWIKNRIFAPRNLRKKSLTQEMKGVYIPCFTFDTQSHSKYSIRYGQYYYVTVGSGKNRHQERRVRWYVDSGTQDDNFDDLQIEASQQITQKEMGQMGGFDTQNSVRYHNQFVSGYYSERYSKSLDESWIDAQKLANNKIVQEIKNRYNADVVDYCNVESEFYKTTYKYCLVPMWLIKYNYDNKKYGCVLNGRNGKIIGKAPLSWVKVSLASIFGGGLIALIVYLMMMYLG